MISYFTTDQNNSATLVFLPINATKPTVEWKGDGKKRGLQQKEDRKGKNRNEEERICEKKKGEARRGKEKRGECKIN